MDNKTFEDALDEVFDEMKKVLISKRHVYGTGNIPQFGELGVLVRASDKIQRLRNILYLKPTGVENSIAVETIDDTWKDLLGYAALALILRKGEFELPLKQS